MDLLERQAALQEEARRLAEEHRIEEILGRLGRVVPLGSAVTGLMVWRDVDYCVELAAGADIWRTLLPLLERCTRLDYLHDAERHTFVLRLDGWKVDLSLFEGELPRGIGPYPTGLDEATRLLLLGLKQEWRDRHPGEDLVWSYEIYDGVLEHGLRTIDAVEQHIRRSTS